MTLAGEDLALFERTLEHATGTTSGATLDAALDDLGWHDALAEDRRAAVSLLFELQGRANATSSALDAVVGGPLGLDPGTAVVIPGPGRLAVATAGIERAERAFVGGEVVAVKELELRRIRGIDPSLGLVEVVGAAGVTDPVAVAAGQLALAHELVGSSRSMLELARVHALERVQFDRPIAQFQAVRHKLAETLVAIEGADDAAQAAWELGTPLAAAAAKAIAGRSARVAAKHCQQVLAGIGFTTEHPFHHHLRRSLVLDRLLGDSKSLTKQIGKQLLASRVVPPMLPL